MLKQSNEKELYFNISALADALNVHQRTLRIYDAEGVLCARRTEKTAAPTLWMTLKEENVLNF